MSYAIPNSFVANTKIQSAAVNANFTYLINILNTPLPNTSLSGPANTALLFTSAGVGSDSTSASSATNGGVPYFPLAVQSGDPSAPATGNLLIYNKGAALYTIDPSSNVTRISPAAAHPTVKLFTGGSYYTFTVSSANATIGATYTNNSQTFTVLYTIAGGTLLSCFGTGAPASSGTLAKASGTGDAGITFSANVATGTYITPAASPTYIRVMGCAGGGGGAGSGLGNTAGNGNFGGSTTFGSFVTASGGGGGVATTSSDQQGAAGGSVTLGGGAIDLGSVSGGSGGGSDHTLTGGTATLPGGFGGTNPKGGAGGGGGANNNGQSAAAGTGAGGGGGGTTNSNTSSGAGGGAGGYFDFLVYSPSGNYSFTVGTGGSGGTGGTNGFLGGSGGTGFLTVIEYYQ